MKVMKISINNNNVIAMYNVVISMKIMKNNEIIIILIYVMCVCVMKVIINNIIIYQLMCNE